MRHGSVIVASKRDAIFVQAVTSTFRKDTTIEQVLENPAVRGYATSDEFTRAQRGLVATTVSVMQDRLIAQLNENVGQLRSILDDQRLLSLSVMRTMAINAAASARALWSIPVIGSAHPPALDAGNKGRRAIIWQWLNWGNFITVAALILLAVAIYSTKAYASYKDRADNQSAVIEEIQQQNSDLQADRKAKADLLLASQDELTDANQQLAFWRAHAENSEKRVEELEQRAGQAAGEVQQAEGEVKALRAQLTAAAAELASLRSQVNSGASSTATLSDLWKRANSELENKNRAIIRLERENQRLKAAIERLESERRTARRS